MKKLRCCITIFLWAHHLIMGAPREPKPTWQVQQSNNTKHTIAIVSSGAVGPTIAHTLILKKMDLDLILVDINAQQNALKSSDFTQNLIFQEHNLRYGTLKDAGQADIIIIAIAACQGENQPVAKLVKKNKALLTQCVGQMAPFNKKSIILVATDPVDLMTYYMHQMAGLTYNQIFGIGTYLETAHVRACISKLLGVSANAVNTFILGEYGENQVTAWSSASIAGIPLQQKYPHIDQISKHIPCSKMYLMQDQENINHFNLSNCVADILKSILLDKKKIMTVSCYNEQHSIYFSQPAVVGKHGIEKIFIPFLNSQEQEKLNFCIQNIIGMIQL